MKIQQVDDHFATAAQIQPDDLAALAQSGFKAIICARPDNEDPGQPAFADIARAAEVAGLKAFHIPVSGPLTEGQLIRFQQAEADAGGPILGYCRSGGRAGSLYKATR
ncbi:TIGR01244 family sulfur transferase [Devosia rhodophyticola]|uniref:TIGR01244 family sulfur transferase n=1 Tax=Devosia rhodophyticola TaxID=3026423 RepID=A0ABY7YVX4_9HYPH|nr:TIGR01244 family sulfur transferase [Devosia rhodophyticola]WDR05263.1 TIGR01244 family sulfur transferase [Devosia rhodophyticola]